MSQRSSRPVRRLLEKIFPPTPDFLGMLAEHAGVVRGAYDALRRQLDGDEAGLAKLLERGAELRRAHIDALNRTFITPIDREDIYLASQSLSQVLEYIESTEREMDLLEIAPDKHILGMLDVLGAGVGALASGFTALDGNLKEAEEHAQAAIASERRMEELYRRALADMFRSEAIATLRADAAPAVDCLDLMVSMLKAREVYRHISNAADRVALAGETLHDIVVKWA